MQFLTNTLAIAGRELGSYFRSFIAYVVLAAFLIVNGYFFAVGVAFSRTADLRPLFQTMYTMMLLMSPIVTMRLIAEERKSGTIELLLTSPVRDWEVILGKFFGGLAFFAVGLILTMFYPVILLMFGTPDLGILLSGYLGALVFAGATVGIGLMASSFTTNQIVAAVVTFALLLLLWVIDAIGQIFGSELSRGLSYISLFPHFNDFSKGLIDSSHVVYFLSLIAASIFIATRSLEARHWR